MTLDTTMDERRRRRALVTANPLDATIAAWKAARRAFRSAKGYHEECTTEHESGLLETILYDLADAGVPGAAEFVATMLDVDEAIRFEIHGPYNPKGHPTP